jgi:putative restriction endonuclease
MSLADINTRQAVLAAIAEYDALGQATFLAKYGFGAARSYFLLHDGRRYDSKAIMGAAHGYAFPAQGPLRAADFSGGEATVARKLEQLGFTVERGAHTARLDRDTPRPVWIFALTASSNWGDVATFYDDVFTEGDPILIDSPVWGTIRHKGMHPQQGDGIAFYHSSRARFPRPDPYRGKQRISLIGTIESIEPDNRGGVSHLTVSVPRSIFDALRARPIVRDDSTAYLFEACGILPGPPATFYEAPPDVWAALVEQISVPLDNSGEAPSIQPSLPTEDLVNTERSARLEQWAQVQARGGPLGLAPLLLRELGIYSGAQGIWVDKMRTRTLTPDGAGVTVSVLHTGSVFADDFSTTGVIYHYPQTRRPLGRDAAEIAATKAAGRLQLPIFVITHPQVDAETRDVWLGWVEDWDDATRLFLITIAEQPPAAPDGQYDDTTPFSLVAPTQATRRTTGTARPNQQRFKFEVFQRYGAACAVCGIAVQEVLQAAHIRSKQARGSDDPRNGLVLCALHHSAFDADLFIIEPNTLAIS